MVDKFMLFRLSFFPRWLYSDEHRWFTQAATKPKECVSFDGIISNGICQVWPTPALPDGSCLQRLRLGRLWLITFGQNLRRRLRWASWWREELWRFLCWCGFEPLLWNMHCIRYSTRTSFIKFCVGALKRDFGLSPSHILKWSEICYPEGSQHYKWKIQKASYTFHEHAVHWSKEWWHLHQEGAWLPVTVQDSLEMRAVSQGSVS